MGPATGFFFLIKFWKDIKNLIFENKFNLNIGFLQLIFLLMFAQGRADYYFSPLLLLVCGTRNLFKDEINNKKYLIINPKTIMKFFFIAQFFIFTISTFYMISLNIFTIVNYEKAMNMTAFGYYNSKLIKKIGVEPVLGLAAQPPRLFYHSEFVPNHNYWKCLKYSNYADEKDRKIFVCKN